MTTETPVTASQATPATAVAAPASESPSAPPAQPVSIDVLIEKYAKGDEQSIEDVQQRVASALAEMEVPHHFDKWREAFFQALQGGFIPAGRINSAAGTAINATLINCFVQPVGDSIAQMDDDHPGIYTALTEAAETMRRGGGVGYDFSRIRPRGAWVGSTQSSASGPVSYMRVFDRSCETVESAGARRGAQMGALRCDHPDIEEFIHAKDTGDLRNFNISVGITDAFMEAVQAGGDIELVHPAEPGTKLKAEGAYQRSDGLWVYRTLPAADLWDQVMRSTYDHAEPGVLFLDRINRDNNLSYCETIAVSNPCGEQPLPPYGCCCLGSIDLTRFVRNAFEADARFDFDGFKAMVRVAIRMLDNVLDATVWPLDKQREEAANKRRVGLGFTGLGDALVMLNLRYDTLQARDMAATISEVMRDEAYGASVDLAAERGAFPMFNADMYLSRGTFASRLPAELKDRIREGGMRNSHLLSIAPTGTISLAFADNASNGIEPAFSWTYTRKKRMPDGSSKEYAVEDHAWRLYRHLKGADAPLTDAFVTALEMSAQAHAQMVAAVAPFIDTAISKTVNVPADYPYADFQDLYLEAWRAGLKGLATYRPNAVLGSVLSVSAPAPAAPASADELKDNDPDRRLTLKSLPEPVLGSLRWPSRPALPEGNPAWTFVVDSGQSKFAVTVGHTQNGRPHPFEVWVLGGEQERGLGAVAKTLSGDMRADDLVWLRRKLDVLKSVNEGSRIKLRLGEREVVAQSASAALALVVEFRLGQLQLTPVADEKSALVEALMSSKEPVAGPEGTLSWTADVSNVHMGDDLSLFLKEAMLPDGSRRPYAIRLAGRFPRELDGLCGLLSEDMRVVDPAWVGMKLRKLLSYSEPMGELFVRVPGSEKSQAYPSTVAYIAALVLHRYHQLGILTEAGHPVQHMGVLVRDEAAGPAEDHALVAEPGRQEIAGQECPECHAMAYIRKDGCKHCTACGHTGECG